MNWIRKAVQASLPALAALALPIVSAGQSPPSLAITSPTTGIVVTPGSNVMVTVTPSPGSNFIAVALAAQGLAGGAALTVPPYTFQLYVPSDVIGAREVTATGVTSPGQGVLSNSVVIDAESPSVVTQIAENMGTLRFQRAGQSLPLDTIATLADGTTLNITGSTRLAFTSGNPLVAIVDATGHVTATGQGEATIAVSYGAVSASVNVIVPTTLRGDLNNDGRVDKEDLNIIQAALNTSASNPYDARDLNHDGVINVLDARILVTLCTYAGCATSPP
jgi:hypothetical protein